MSEKYEILNGEQFRRKVRAVIANEHGEFLLIQPNTYEDGKWTFVGGGIEPSENPMQAMVRELREEIGPQNLLAVKQSSNVHRYKYSKTYLDKRNLDHIGQVAFLFWVEIAANAPILIQESEVKRYRWAKLSEIKNLVSVPAQLEMFNNLLLEFSPLYPVQVAS